MGALGISVVMEVLIAIGLIAVLYMVVSPKGKSVATEEERRTEAEEVISASPEPPTTAAAATDAVTCENCKPEAPTEEIITADGTESETYVQGKAIAVTEIAAADATTEEYRLVKSFTAKLILSDDILKERYSDIKNALLAYKKVKARTCWKCETFRYGRIVIAKLMIRGKTLCLYLALSAEEIPSEKYKVENVKQKAGAITPTMYKIKNARRVKNAKQLIRIIAEKQGLTAFNRAEENFAPAYQTEEALLTEGLIKGTTFYGRE